MLNIFKYTLFKTRPKASGSSSRFQEGRGNRLRTRQGQDRDEIGTRQGQDMEGGGQGRVRGEGGVGRRGGKVKV